MALTHNSKLSKSEPAWDSVPHQKLPRNAYADPGDPNDSSTWKHPYHHVRNADIGTSGVFVRGEMFLHLGELKNLLSTTVGQMPDAVQKHLRAHMFATDPEVFKRTLRGGSSVSRETAAYIKPAKTVMVDELSLKAVSPVIQKTETVDALKGLETDVLVRCEEKKKASSNWIEEQKWDSLAQQSQKLIALRRREILSQPAITRERELYKLGRAVGRET